MPNSTPPIVGVPVFAWCDCGASSYAVWRAAKRRSTPISGLPSSAVTTNAGTPAISSASTRMPSPCGHSDTANPLNSTRTYHNGGPCMSFKSMSLTAVTSGCGPWPRQASTTMGVCSSPLPCGLPISARSTAPRSTLRRGAERFRFAQVVRVDDRDVHAERVREL